MVQSTNRIADGSQAQSAIELSGTILLVERRTLFRESVRKRLSDIFSVEVLALPTISEWGALTEKSGCPSVVALCVAAREQVKPGIELVNEHFSGSGRTPPVILLSDDEDPLCALDALDAGAKGFVPTSVSLEVAAEAIRLVMAGGSYVPASILLASRAQNAHAGSGSEALRNAFFTERQFAVIERLREGKANKIIAYELNMRESTVKVHIRNIMRKMQATNRTEVAYLYQSMISEKRTNGVE